jgi:hypothetical protein
MNGEWSRDRISWDRKWYFSWDRNYHFAKLIMRSKLLQINQEIEKGLGALKGLGFG